MTSKYMVQSAYDFFKSNGDTAMDNNQGIELMLEKFPGYFTKEQLRADMQQYNVQSIFALVKEYFQREYNYAGNDIELNNRYQRTVNSYIYNDEENKKEPAVVHIDELFESALVAFFLVTFKWSKDFDNLETYKGCFRHMLFLMNEVCILGEMQGANASRVMLEIIGQDLQIMQLAGDCYWTVLIFSIAHELAHAYLASTGKNRDGDLKQEEAKADLIAYDIVLKIIMEGCQGSHKIILGPYTYLAPLMYMDFFDLIFYTNKVLYHVTYTDDTHPALEERKSFLLELANKDEYDFDNREGNDLYSAFLDICDEFKEQVNLKYKQGKLDSIIYFEEKNQMRKYMDE